MTTMSNQDLSDIRIKHTAAYNILKTIEKYYPNNVPSVEFFLSLSPQEKSFISTVAEAFWRDGMDSAKQAQLTHEGENYEWNNLTDTAHHRMQAGT